MSPPHRLPACSSPARPSWAVRAKVSGLIKEPAEEPAHSTWGRGGCRGEGPPASRPTEGAGSQPDLPFGVNPLQSHIVS